MKLTHIDCQDPKCYLCFVQHIDLKEALEDKTGVFMEDHLSVYHKWLSDNGINPETEWGWGTQEYFDDENIERYVKYYLKEHYETI